MKLSLDQNDDVVVQRVDTENSPLNGKHTKTYHLNQPSLTQHDFTRNLKPLKEVGGNTGDKVVLNNLV